MPGYFSLKESNCKNCYKCIRHCPVKAISFSKNQAHVLEEECILCGKCFVNCPQKVKSIRNDLPQVKGFLRGGQEVFASVAPSVAAVYPDASFETIRQALLALGFSGAEETALGATVVKKRYEELINEGKQEVIISTCCPSVNMLISRYYPENVQYLARVVSPMTAHGYMIKKDHPSAKVVFIGPCVAKKAEAEEHSDAIDAVLTFEDLAVWLEQERVVPAMSDRKEETTGRARLFPTTGGVLETMDVPQSTSYSLFAIDGVENCIAALEDIKKGNAGRCFIEMSACAGSCIAGPVFGHKETHPVKDRLAVHRSAGASDFDVTMLEAEKLDNKVPVIMAESEKPSARSIDEVLRKMGKTLPEHELNCGSCGYETCREKAAAVLMGKAEMNMCLPYLMARAESFSDKIINHTPNAVIVLNKQLEIQQINPSACRLLNIRDAEGLIGRSSVCVLDPEPFAQVLSDGQNSDIRNVYLAEYGKYVDMTIVLDKTYDILFAIIRDITVEHAEQADKDATGRKAIEIADKVIEKQMRTVQEIASLLGETTAETKIALEKLKETFVE